MLDDLVKEWGVEDKWTKEARLEAVREWHSLPGTSGLVVRVPWDRAANLATTPLARLGRFLGRIEAVAQEIHLASLDRVAMRKPGLRLYQLDRLCRSTLTNGDLAVMIKMCRRADLTVDTHITLV